MVVLFAFLISFAFGEYCEANENDEFLFKFNPFHSKTGYYEVEGCEGFQPTLVMKAGVTYTFIQRDVSNWYHPLGFAYFPDGAHVGVPELEPTCSSEGCDDDCVGECCASEGCDAPLYYINDMFVGGESGDGGFGLDEFEPQFFWPRERWEENVYTIQLTITSEIAEFFYFCHIHNRMSGRIKVANEDGSLRSDQDDIALGYSYANRSEFDQMCGTTGMSEYSRLEKFQEYCPGMTFICADSPNDWIDCNEATECYMNYMMKSTFTGDSIQLFMEQMIPHHEQAIEMSKILLQFESENNLDPDIEYLAWEIINHQNAQIGTMEGWLDENSKVRTQCDADESLPDFIPENLVEMEYTFGALCEATDGVFAFKHDASVSEMGYYTVDGCEGYQPTLVIDRGETYTFVQADASNWMHPLGFAYLPDGAHLDNPELEPGCSAEGCDEDCVGACCETGTCDAPQYMVGGIPITDDESGFGLDAYEPDFFLPIDQWVEVADQYTISLTVTSDVEEIFYFCHIHNYMSGRIQIRGSTAEPVPLPYEYQLPTDFDSHCGFTGLKEYSRYGDYNSFCGDDQYFCYDTQTSFVDCMEAVDCHMNAEMRVSYIDPVTTFMHQMIPHHQNAVNMAKALYKDANVEHMKDSEDETEASLYFLVKEIINVQNYQINVMEGWLAANNMPHDNFCTRSGSHFFQKHFDGILHLPSSRILS